MTYTLSSLVCLVLLVSCTCAVVYRLTSHTIDGVFATNDIVVLKFCAHWSTSCKEIAPVYENASNAVYPLGKIFFGTIDAKTESKLRNQYNIWSYPHITVRKFDGSLIHYRGRVHAAGIISFVKRAAYINLNAVYEPKHIDEFLHFEDVAVLGHFVDTKKEYHNYLEIVKRLQPKMMIGFASNTKYLREAYGIDPSPASVMVFKRFENSMTVYKGDFSMQVLASWILENTKLPVNFLQPENAFKYMGFKIPGVLLFLDTLNANVTTIGQHTLQQAISNGDHLSITTIHTSATPSPSTTITSSTLTNPDGSITHTTNAETRGDGTQSIHTTHTTHTVQKSQDSHFVTHSSSHAFISSSKSSHTARTSTSTTKTNTEGSKKIRELMEKPLRKNLINTPTNGLEVVQNVIDNIVALQSENEEQEGDSHVVENGVESERECDGEFLSCLAMFHELATEYKGQLNFVYTDGLSFQPFMNRLGLRNLPSIVIFDWSQEKHYLLDPTLSITKPHLRTFFSDFFSNQLSHFIRSARPSPLPPPPLSNLVFNEGNKTRIVRVIADQFDELVMGSNSHVLLYIHLPWCGYCKATWPTYEKLATLVTDTTVTIAEFDASLNDMPRNFPLTAWPTLFPHVILFPATNKSHPIVMINELSLRYMGRFLSDNIPSVQIDQEEFEASVEDEETFLQQLLQSQK